MTVDTRIPNVFDAALGAIAYHDLSHPDEAHREIKRAREQAPVALSQYGVEVLSYDLVRTVLRDPRFVIPKGIGLAAQGITSGPVWDRVCRLLISVDGDQHRRLRHLVARAFTPRAAERMRSACVEVITELVERHVAAGRCDVVTDIARPYPVAIICALIGAPRRDWHLFSGWADDISKAFGLNVAEETPAILRAWTQLEAYIEMLIAERRHHLSDDLLSELIRAEDAGDRLSHDELVNLVAILLNAGTDTTRNQLAAAVHVLMDHPDQWALLATHPDLAPRAVEELIRHTPIVLTALRQAGEDVCLGGVVFPAGSLVVANTASANRDLAVFHDPERVDITRDAPAALLSFGGGVHYCLGAHLARVELVEALRVITSRIRCPHRSGPVPWKPVSGIGGPVTLPIEFVTQCCAINPFVHSQEGE